MDRREVMDFTISEDSLPVFEALASKVRINVIKLLAEHPRNIKELADALGLSSAIMTMHIRKLEKAGIIHTEIVRGKGGLQKKCILSIERLEVVFPTKELKKKKYHDVSVSVGHYTDFDVAPTCGLATTKNIVGEFDDPRSFLHPDRVNAKILWFKKGYVEYKVPNFLLNSQRPKGLGIYIELSSEAPFTNNNWPSDIHFSLNNVPLGKWTSHGDFGDSHGKYTPSWWPNDVNQYGILKSLRINSKGTYIDGIRISNITIEDVDILDKQWTFRIAVQDDSENVGGVTLFGAGFGNYNQDLIFRLDYEEIQPH